MQIVLRAYQLLDTPGAGVAIDGILLEPERCALAGESMGSLLFVLVFNTFEPDRFALND